jgi:hypothetical protein
MDKAVDAHHPEEAPALDLHRRELRLVLDRYVHNLALLVGRRPERIAALKSELEGRGYLVQSCEGPGRTPCPLLAGEPCGLRESADVTIAFVGDIDTPQGRSSPKVVCAAHGASPAVIAVEGSFSRERRNGRYAVIGALRRAEDLAEAADEVLTSERD